MSAPRTTAVFLSYAHEDAPSAQRFARALRDAGIEVWLDENELRGGEAWDQKIRRQIRDCALFVPVISANTQARREGYFRLEWRLAVERMRHMDDDLAFLVPLVIDGTPNARAFVPDEFHTVQWTRLPDGTATPAVIEQVRRLLAGPTHAPFSAPRSDLQISPGPTRRVPWRRWLAAAVIITIAAAASVAIWWRAGRRHPPPATPTPAPAAVSDPRSIAVLPFENLSTGPDTVYFADGMHEEVLTALAKVSSLKVIARTSVLRYADPRTRDLGRIAADLNVANVLEGSVRHSGNKVRIAVQLVDARTSRQLWASTYERELTDVFAIQAAIAQEITATLQAALTPGERSRLEQRPTANPEAYELYLRAMSALHDLGTPSLASREKIEAVLALFERAAAADPQFALPLVQL
ncbi:MAG TPA: TIR domain-containing protein, partial [Opitutus sp.]|nr:TIR domain-containing protein [Opitutus sp.]